MWAFKHRAGFPGDNDRDTYFHAYPLTGRYGFRISTLPTYANNETYEFYFDHSPNLLHYAPVPKPKQDPAYAHVTFSQLFDTHTPFRST